MICIVRNTFISPNAGIPNVHHEYCGRRHD